MLSSYYLYKLLAAINLFKMKKICAKKGCENQPETNRHKYCSKSCKYWAGSIRKEDSGWGSKNSQMRLDKKARTFAKKIFTGKQMVRF